MGNKKFRDKSPFMALLWFMGMFLPGNFLKTWFYLNGIAKPRKALRGSLDSFYRMDLVYDVLKEFNKLYKGKFSILEFGTADGYAYTKMLYATKYLGMEDRVMVHAFDSFEGMPPPVDEKDQDLIANDGWVQAQFRGRYEELLEHCRYHYKNFSIHKGYFEKTLTNDFLEGLKVDLPILVWIDCDYYSSAYTVLERILSYLPSGCVIYFDDIEFNFGSKFTGEARIVHEINQGLLGDNVELVLDRSLSLNTNRVYRFIRCDGTIHYEKISKSNVAEHVRCRTNDSPLP
jgi:hypothetical protein